MTRLSYALFAGLILAGIAAPARGASILLCT